MDIKRVENWRCLMLSSSTEMLNRGVFCLVSIIMGAMKWPRRRLAKVDVASFAQQLLGGNGGIPSPHTP